MLMKCPSGDDIQWLAIAETHEQDKLKSAKDDGEDFRRIYHCKWHNF